MNEKPSPFCPPECLFQGVKKMCTTDCIHSRDKKFAHPRVIEMLWCGEWVNAKIVGESQGKYYIESDKGNFTVIKTSETIRKGKPKRNYSSK